MAANAAGSIGLVAAAMAEAEDVGSGEVLPEVVSSRINDKTEEM